MADKPGSAVSGLFAKGNSGVTKETDMFYWLSTRSNGS